LLSFSSLFSPPPLPPPPPIVLTTTGFTSRTLAERSHAYFKSPGYSTVAPLKLGSFRLSLGPVKAPLEVRGSAGSSRLQIKLLPLPPELTPAPPPPPQFRRLLQSPPPLLLSSFATTTTEPFSSRGCHQQEREEGREREGEEEEAPGRGEKSNAALEEGDAGEVTTASSPSSPRAPRSPEEENDAAAEGSPHALLPCPLASPLLTNTLAAQAAETGGSHAMPASATSSSKAPQGESS